MNEAFKQQIKLALVNAYTCKDIFYLNTIDNVKHEIIVASIWGTVCLNDHFRILILVQSQCPPRITHHVCPLMS